MQPHFLYFSFFSIYQNAELTSIQSTQVTNFTTFFLILSQSNSISNKELFTRINTRMATIINKVCSFLSFFFFSNNIFNFNYQQENIQQISTIIFHKTMTKINNLWTSNKNQQHMNKDQIELRDKVSTFFIFAFSQTPNVYTNNMKNSA